MQFSNVFGKVEKIGVFICVDWDLIILGALILSWLFVDFIELLKSWNW